jgi:hypothetical protein
LALLWLEFLPSMGLFAFLLVFWGDRFDAFDDLLQLTFF